MTGSKSKGGAAPLERNLLGFFAGKAWELFLYLLLPPLAYYFDSTDAEAMALAIAVTLGLVLVVGLRASRIFHRLKSIAKHGPLQVLFIHGGESEDEARYLQMKQVSSIGTVRSDPFDLMKEGGDFEEDLRKKLTTSTVLCLIWGRKVSVLHKSLMPIIEDTLIAHKERPFIIADFNGALKDDADLRILNDRYTVISEPDASKSVMFLLTQSIQRTGQFVLISQYFRLGLACATIALVGLLVVIGLLDRKRSAEAWEKGFLVPLMEVKDLHAELENPDSNIVSSNSGAVHEYLRAYLHSKQELLKDLLDDPSIRISLWHPQTNGYMKRIVGGSGSSIDTLPIDASLVGCACRNAEGEGALYGISLDSTRVLETKQYSLRAQGSTLSSGSPLACSVGTFDGGKQGIMVASIKHTRKGGSCCVVSISSGDSPEMITDRFKNYVVQTTLQECIALVAAFPE